MVVGGGGGGMGAPSFYGRGGGGAVRAFGRFNQWGEGTVRFQPIQPVWWMHMYVNFYYRGVGGGGGTIQSRRGEPWPP